MNATNIELYWRWQHHTTLRVRMCYLNKSVIKGLEMSIRFLLPKKTKTNQNNPPKQTNKPKTPSVLKGGLHSGLCSPLTECMVLWRMRVVLQEHKSFTYWQRRAGLGITLLHSLRWSASAEGFVWSCGFWILSCPLQDHFTWAVTDNSNWKKTALKCVNRWSALWTFQSESQHFLLWSVIYTLYIPFTDKCSY